MSNTTSLEQIKSLLQEGMALAKCKKCKCMRDAFDILNSLQVPSDVQDMFNHYQPQLEPIEYT